MFNRSSPLLSVITVLFVLTNTPCSAIPPSTLQIKIFHFFPPGFIPVLGKLRNNKEVLALIKKVQNSQKDEKQQNKPPLSETESVQIQAAIQKSFSDSKNQIETDYQKVSNKEKCIIHFRAETDMQLGPVPVYMYILIVPNENLTEEEDAYVKNYCATFSKLEEIFRLLLERIAKEMSQSNEGIKEVFDKATTNTKSTAKVVGKR